MTKIIGLDGKPFEGPQAGERDLLPALKALVAALEKGDVPKPEMFIFLYGYECPKHPGNMNRAYMASDMMVATAVYELEMFKHRLLQGS